jgi:hypothetical protein
MLLAVLINLCLSAPANGTEDQDTEASRVKRGYGHGGGGGGGEYKSWPNEVPVHKRNTNTKMVADMSLCEFIGGGGGGHGHGPGKPLNIVSCYQQDTK